MKNKNSTRRTGREGSKYADNIKMDFRITTNKLQRFLIYLFLQMFYMFQAVPPPIIRSTELYIQLRVLSTNTAASCYRGWDGTPFHLIHDSS